MWIWQQPDWPGRKQETSQVFRYDHTALTPKLRELHFLQGILLGKMGVQNNQQEKQNGRGNLHDAKIHKCEKVHPHATMPNEK